MKRLFRGLNSLWAGFFSIGQGMSTFNLFPTVEPPKFGTYKHDINALKEDWKKIKADGLKSRNERTP